MGSDQRKTPQMTTAMPERLRAQAVAIAKARGESDAIGVGFSAVVRRWTRQYVARNHDLLPEHLRD